MATLAAAQKVVLAGLEVTFAAAAGGGDEFANSGNQFMWIKNGGGGSITVTFDSPNADNFGVQDAAHDQAVVVTNGEDRLIGPFPVNRFNDSSDKVQVTYSGVTTVTVAMVEFNPTGV